jgi:hypothetical protein
LIIYIIKAKKEGTKEEEEEEGCELDAWLPDESCFCLVDRLISIFVVLFLFLLLLLHTHTPPSSF